MRNIIIDFYPLISSLSAMLFSQIIKLIAMVAAGKNIKVSTFTRSGGMPSSHSALITAITLSVGLKEGFNSSFFFLSIVLSLVVIYDARGIRYTVGKHAKLLNTNILEEETQKLNEHVGHTMPEIIAGIAVGAFIAIAMYNLTFF